MGRYVTWGRCLDCQAEIGAASACPRCGLVQHDVAANRLRWLLTEADQALTAARQSAAAESDSAEPGAPKGSSDIADHPAYRSPAAPRTPVPKRTVPSTSAVLLGLGAVFLVVAAIVFVSVQWSDLSIGAKAAVLLAVTAVFGALTWWSIGRRLRTSAQAFSSIFVILAGVDFAAAHAGGLLGDAVTDDAASWITAAIVAVAGAAWAKVAVATRIAPLSAPQHLASLGVLWICVAALDEPWSTRDEYVALALMIACVSLAVVAARLALWTLAAGLVVVAALMFLTAFVGSLERIIDGSTLQALWSTGSAVGWVLCLTVAVLAASSRLVARPIRRLAACTVTIGLALLVLRPLDGQPREDWLAAFAATAVGLAVLAVVATPLWRLAARAALVPVAIGVAAAAAPAVLLATARIVVPATDPWGQEYGDRTHLDRWLLDVDSRPITSGLALYATLLAVTLALRLRLPSGWSLALLATPCVGVAVLGRAWPLWGVVVVLAMLALVGGVVALATRATTATVAAYVAAAYTALALTAALGSDVTTAVAAAGVCVVLAAVAYFAEDDRAASASAAGSLTFGALAATAVLAARDVSDSAAGYVCVGIAAVAVFAAQLRPAGSAIRTRLGLEVGALAVGAAAAGLAAHDPRVQLPICLTVAGASMTAVGVLRTDRRPARVAGGVILIAATWSRLLAQDVDTVEWYTLPTAIVLCAIGVWLVHTRPDASSAFHLSPGLSLLLGPSLIATLPDPTSTRALLLGIGSFAILVAGAYLRWAAPLVVASVVLLTLAVVNLAPYANAVPRWVLFGLAGAALLYLGVTWERRLRNARTLIMAVELMR
jgi:hypothetical protein